MKILLFGVSNVGKSVTGELLANRRHNFMHPEETINNIEFYTDSECYELDDYEFIKAHPTFFIRNSFFRFP